jgi:hypothetical protein
VGCVINGCEDVGCGGIGCDIVNCNNVVVCDVVVCDVVDVTDWEVVGCVIVADCIVFVVATASGGDIGISTSGKKLFIGHLFFIQTLMK